MMIFTNSLYFLQMVFYIEACESGSMFHRLLPNNIKGMAYHVLEHCLLALCQTLPFIVFEPQFFPPLSLVKSQPCGGQCQLWISSVSA